ncbi:hypothetical protein Tco_1051211 [Tanacetum coccineum]
MVGLKPSRENGQQRPTISVGGREIAFKNFMYAETDMDLSFIPKDPSLDFSTGSPSASINTEPPITRACKIIGLPDVLEMQNVNACHLKISVRGECEVLKEMEKSRDQECKDLKSKCEAAMTEFDNNPAVIILRVKIATLLGEASLLTLESKVASLEAEKVVPDVATELVQSDDMGKLVAKLVSSAIFYGRRHAFEEVANMKEPFDITKVKGYRPSYKQKHTKAGNEFATATFPYLADVVADPYATPSSALMSQPLSHPSHVTPVVALVSKL